MSQSILYTPRTCKLKDIAHSTCPNGFDPSVYEELLLERNPTVNASRINANKAIILPETGSQFKGATNLHRLESSNRQEREVLSSLSNHAGGAAVLGLANFLQETKIPEQTGDLVTFGGNGMGASVSASSTVLGAISSYDHALNDYEQLKNNRAAPRTVHAAKLKAERAFEKMNNAFNKQAFGYLNNLDYKMRATTNVNGRKVWESIPVGNNGDVQKLAKLAKVGRVLGPGVILLDGYLRANKVHHMRKNNNPNWKRERFVQSGAFVAGVATGVLIGLALTPAGIIVALAAGGAAGIILDSVVQDRLEAFYDRFLND